MTPLAGGGPPRAAALCLAAALFLAAAGCAAEPESGEGGADRAAEGTPTPAEAGEGAGIPAALSEYLEADSARGREVSEGVGYTYLWSPRGPWAVHLLAVDLGRCDLGVDVVSAGEAGEELATVTRLAATAGDDVLAAVNGDFFTPEGRPLGPEVNGGRVHFIRGRPALAWKPGEAPWVGLPEERDDSLSLGAWSVRREAAGEGAEVVGGFPELLDQGRRAGDLAVTSRPAFAASRHPRTAVGYDEDTGLLWLVVVDGRQPGHSMGMTLPELLEVMEALGAEEALNLDGGGSSVMLVGGETMSRPSDEAGERPVVNALVVRRDSTYCAAGDRRE